jgi:enterobacterial common antigen flippase
VAVEEPAAPGGGTTRPRPPPTVRRAAGAPLRSALRATALLSGSSILVILISLVSGKARAALLGPGGFGLNALLQAVLAMGVLVGGLGLGAGVVRGLAKARAEDDPAEAAAIRKAAWLIRLAIGLAAVLAIAVFRHPISRLALGGEQNVTSLLIADGALGLMLVGDLQGAILNGYQRVGALAKLSVLNAAAGAAVSTGIFVIFRSRGIAPALVATAAIGCVLTRWYVNREAKRTAAALSREHLRAASLRLLRFGAPFMASQAVGGGVQMILPIIVVTSLGIRSVGFYQAALTVAGTYLGFLLAAMATDYYPRISAASGDAKRLLTLIDYQQRLVLVISLPLILGVLALAPYVVPIVYSPAFAPAVAVLEWMLIGDLFKFLSWTLSFVILARSGAATFFAIEFVGGATLLSMSWLGLHTFGLPGLGVGWVITYVVYLTLCWVIVRRDLGFSWSPGNARVILGAVLTMCAVRLATLTGNEPVRLSVSLTCATGAVIFSLLTLRRELGPGWAKRFLSRRRPRV